jgi:hypothetical protein
MVQPIIFTLIGKARRGGMCPLMPGMTPPPATKLLISGVTKDSSGAALAGCTVSLYRTSDDVLMEKTNSDGSGAYRFSAVGLSETYYVVAYKAGSPDVAGTTVNTLTGV